MQKKSIGIAMCFLLLGSFFSIEIQCSQKSDEFLAKVMSSRSQIVGVSYKATQTGLDKNNSVIPTQNGTFKRIRSGNKIQDIRFGESVTFIDGDSHKKMVAKKGKPLSEEYYSRETDQEPEDRLLIMLSKYRNKLQVVTENAQTIAFSTQLATENMRVTITKAPLWIVSVSLSNKTTGLEVSFFQEGTVKKSFFIPKIQTLVITNGGDFIRKIVTTYEDFVINPEIDPEKFSIKHFKGTERGGPKND